MKSVPFEPGASPQVPDVLLVGHGFQSEYESGFANGLAINGWYPALVCSDALAPAALLPTVTRLALRGSQDPRRSRLQKVVNILRYAGALAREMMRARRHAVPVHYIGMFTLAHPLAVIAEALAARALARDWVLTVHNLLPHDRHGALNRLIYRFVYRLPRLLVVHTPRMAHRLEREFGVPERRVLVVQHGINRLLPHDAAARCRLRQQHGLRPSDRLVLFFGNVAPYKGLDWLLQAWEQHMVDDSMVLMVVGRCRDTALRATLHGQMKRLGASRRVSWVEGFVPDDDVPSWFHAADLLVMPYRHIDQSGVVFMALASGLPVVASDVGSLSDYVALTGGRTVPPGDAAALAGALRDVAAHVDDGARHRVMARAEGFLWRHTVQVLLSHYRARSG